MYFALVLLICSIKIQQLLVLTFSYYLRISILPSGLAIKERLRILRKKLMLFRSGKRPKALLNPPILSGSGYSAVTIDPLSLKSWPSCFPYHLYFVSSVSVGVCLLL